MSKLVERAVTAIWEALDLGAPLGADAEEYRFDANGRDILVRLSPSGREVILEAALGYLPGNRRDAQSAAVALLRLGAGMAGLNPSAICFGTPGEAFDAAGVFGADAMAALERPVAGKPSEAVAVRAVRALSPGREASEAPKALSDVLQWAELSAAHLDRSETDQVPEAAAEPVFRSGGDFMIIRP